MTESPQFEIERKFLLDGMPSIPPGAEVLRIEQGYLAVAPEGDDAVEGRIRRIERADGRVQHVHTVKTGTGLVRRETEREIDAAEFDALWPRTLGARLRKRRYRVAEASLTWEIDAFDDIELVLAEVELPTPETASPAPRWLAGHVLREVTDEPEFGNFSLARRLGVRVAEDCDADSQGD